jgi:hypothetical protein
MGCTALTTSRLIIDGDIMQRLSRHLAAWLLVLLGSTAHAQIFTPLEQGSTISRAVFVSDQRGDDISLLNLFEAQPGKVNVVFIFGGGDMGANLPGRLWCADSFEDAHILRTLVGKYRSKAVGFVAIASAPVYHSRALGAKDRVFLDAEEDSVSFRAARTGFIASTLAAKDVGTLPIQPYFDLRLRLMLNPGGSLQPGPGYGAKQSWFGAFRAATERQYYGVPSFWLVADDGTVLAPPFRGNVYHPHGTEQHIAYTYADVDAAVSKLLEPAATSSN